ncbi:ATP-grasp domain-containing protein [Vicingaceae bacterium]|nr:ATP-grasp domain-containing protein [Vicingaceae bacterium]MDB4060488.1 ATP-grasp domain-containing protein [Vicingaceae bacterium]
MDSIKVIVTACGCPGASTFIYWLKNKVIERDIYIIGTDMSVEPIGRFIADKFEQIPSADDDDYIPSVKDLISKEKPDIFFCVSSYEVKKISKHKEELEELGTKVIVSDHDIINIASNKFSLYETLKGVAGVSVPNYYNPKTLEEFVRDSELLGYPEKRICFKPHFSKGSRGFRVIDDKVSRKDLLLNYKPESTFISMNEFYSIFKDEKEFPKFLLMELVEGEENDAMVLSMGGEVLLTTIKTRETARAGVITSGELVDRPEIAMSCKKIIEKLPLDYNAAIQFIGNNLIEINTRVSTFIYQEDMIEPYLSIKLALGEYTKEEVKEYQSRIKYGRRMIRYMDQVFF